MTIEANNFNFELFKNVVISAYASRQGEKISSTGTTAGILRIILVSQLLYHKFEFLRYA